MHSLTLSLCVKNCRKASFNNGGGNLHLIHLRRSKCEDENNEKQQGLADQRRDGGPGPNNLDWRTWPKQSRLADRAQTISTGGPGPNNLQVCLRLALKTKRTADAVRFNLC